MYFDIKMGNEEIGRMVIGLFGDVVPKTVLNFKTLAEGTMVRGSTFAWRLQTGPPPLPPPLSVADHMFFFLKFSAKYSYL